MARKPSKSKLIELLENHGGIVLEVATAIGCTRQAVHKWLNDDPDLKQAQISARDALIDKAEAGLKTKIEEGSEKSIIYLLSTLGKKRGYVQRFETQDRSKLDEQLEDMSEEELLGMLSDIDTKLKSK